MVPVLPFFADATKGKDVLWFVVRTQENTQRCGHKTAALCVLYGPKCHACVSVTLTVTELRSKLQLSS